MCPQVGVYTAIDAAADIAAHAAIAAAHHAHVGARVYHSENTSIPNETWTALYFDSERYDTDDIHSVTVQTLRLTCKTAGKYVIALSVSFAANATGHRRIRIVHNGADPIAGNFAPAINATVPCLSVATVYDLAVDGFLIAQVYQDSGGALDVLSLGNESPEFMMQRIG